MTDSISRPAPAPARRARRVSELHTQLAGYAAAVASHAPASVIARYDARLTAIAQSHRTVQLQVDLIEEKYEDARNQAHEGDARDADYWNGKADAYSWAIGMITSNAWESGR